MVEFLLRRIVALQWFQGLRHGAAGTRGSVEKEKTPNRRVGIAALSGRDVSARAVSVAGESELAQRFFVERLDGLRQDGVCDDSVAVSLDLPGRTGSGGRQSDVAAPATRLGGAGAG